MNERVIPESWYRAQTRQTTMAMLTRDRSARRLAPLRDGERELGWFVLPPFQRPPVWTPAQQSRFVESCWMGLPIGVIVYNRGAYNSPRDCWLLDGQQRVTALLAYMADEFPVFGYRFSEISVIDRRRWDLSTAFPMAEMQSEDEDELREVYDRLAYGGTPHEPKFPAPPVQQEG